ncbi:MAG: exonuclease domain-containing protein [bacterium]
MKSNWEVSGQSELSLYLSSRLDIDEPFCRFLINRGADNIKKTEEFLDPKLEFDDVFEKFSGLPGAVSIIQEAINRKDVIAILADSDADGLSGLLILEDALNYPTAETFVCEGPTCGISKKDIEKVVNSNAKVLITVAVGINDAAAIRRLKDAGIKVIITDHHAPCGKHPGADIILDPFCEPRSRAQERDAEEMAGCFVAFYLGAAFKLSRQDGFNEIKISCDIETTGFSPRFSEIIEIGAVKFRGFRIIDKFSSFLKPAGRIPPRITSFTGIRDSDVENAPERGEVLKKFREWISDFPLVFHNAPFDTSFLNSEFRKFLGHELKNKIQDTLAISRRALPSQSHKLEALKDFYNIKSVSHRALSDAETTLKIYNILKHRKIPEFKIFVEQNLPLVALGTISGNVPLLGHSRAAVKAGVGGIFNVKRFAFKMVIKELGLEQPAEIRTLAKKIIPFLNTAKKMNENTKILELFKSKSKKEAKEIIGYIGSLNDARRVRGRHFCLNKPGNFRIDIEWDNWLEKNLQEIYAAMEPFGRGNPFMRVLLREAAVIDETKTKDIYRLKLEKNGKVFNILSDEKTGAEICDIVFHIEKIAGKFYLFLDDYEIKEAGGLPCLACMR